MVTFPVDFPIALFHCHHLLQILMEFDVNASKYVDYFTWCFHLLFSVA